MMLHRTLSAFRRTGLLLALPLLFQACGDDSTTTPPDNTADDTIALTLAASTGSILQGASTPVAATLTRGGGYAGAVTFTVTGAPTGVTAGITNVVTTGTTTTATVTIVAAANVVAGAYPLTVKASGTGVADATAPYTLTVTATTAPNYSIGLAPTSGSVVQSGTTATTATLTRTGSFAGNVTLSLSGAPTGVTAAFTPNATAGNTSAIVLSAASTTVPGVYTVFITGVATGQTDKVIPFVLTVTGAGSYALTLPGTLAMVQGTGGTAAVTLTRTGGFNGSIALTATGLATGMTAVFDATPTLGSASTLTFTTTALTPAGVYPVVVHSNANGTLEQLATINVTVTAAASAANTSVSFAACALTDRPLWFASQDGAGAWTVVNPVSNVYSFFVGSGKGGFAYVTQGAGDNFNVSVQYGNQSELTSSVIHPCAAPVNTSNYTGTVTNVGPAEVASLMIGGGAVSVTGIIANFGITGIAPGAQDLFGWRKASATATVNDRGFLRRDVNMGSGSSLGAIDFLGGESFLPLVGTWSATNGTAALRSLSVASGASCRVAAVNADAGTSLSGIPLTLSRATDFYYLVASEGTATSTRSVAETFKIFGNRSTTFGTVLATPVVTVLSGPYKRLQAVYTLTSEYQNSTTFQVTGASPARVASVKASFGWLGTNVATLAMPDFSTLAGWNNTWAPASGAAVTWTASVMGSNLTSPTICQDGGRTSTATASGTN